MPPVLRKRPAPAPAPEPTAKKPSKVAKAAAKVKEVISGKPAKKEKPADEVKPAAAADPAPVAPAAGKPAVGDVIALEGFGGEVETFDGEKTTLKALVDESKAGVILFTYPKASTPGCTTQACLFRDSYAPLTAGGMAVYGLSTDSPKSNTTFKEKQNLPYSLLCDPAATLIGAIGLKKATKGTQRGVFVIDKSGKVLAAEPGGPPATLQAALKAVEELGGGGEEPAKAAEEKPDGEAEKPAAANGEEAKVEAKL